MSQELQIIRPPQIDAAPEPTPEDLSMERWFRVERHCPERPAIARHNPPKSPKIPYLVKVYTPGVQATDPGCGALYQITPTSMLEHWGVNRQCAVCHHNGQFVDVK